MGLAHILKRATGSKSKVKPPFVIFYLIGKLPILLHDSSNPKREKPTRFMYDVLGTIKFGFIYSFVV